LFPDGNKQLLVKDDAVMFYPMPNIQASNGQKYTKTDTHQNEEITPDTLENEKNSPQK
jgi:hypothetical protein